MDLCAAPKETWKVREKRAEKENMRHFTHFDSLVKQKKKKKIFWKKERNRGGTASEGRTQIERTALGAVSALYAGRTRLAALAAGGISGEQTKCS